MAPVVRRMGSGKTNLDEADIAKLLMTKEGEENSHSDEEEEASKKWVNTPEALRRFGEVHINVNPSPQSGDHDIPHASLPSGAAAVLRNQADPFWTSARVGPDHPPARTQSLAAHKDSSPKDSSKAGLGLTQKGVPGRQGLGLGRAVSLRKAAEIAAIQELAAAKDGSDLQGPAAGKLTQSEAMRGDGEGNRHGGAMDGTRGGREMQPGSQPGSRPSSQQGSLPGSKHSSMPGSPCSPELRRRAVFVKTQSKNRLEDPRSVLLNPPSHRSPLPVRESPLGQSVAPKLGPEAVPDLISKEAPDDDSAGSWPPMDYSHPKPDTEATAHPHQVKRQGSSSAPLPFHVPPGLVGGFDTVKRTHLPKRQDSVMYDTKRVPTPDEHQSAPGASMRHSGMLRKLAGIIPRSGMLRKEDPLAPVVEETKSENGYNSDSMDDMDFDDIPDLKMEKQTSFWNLVQWTALLLLISALVCSFVFASIRKIEIVNVRLWRWLILLVVIVSGRLMSGWLIKLLTAIVEKQYLLRRKVLYFVYGLRHAVRNLIWLSLNITVWTVLFGKYSDRNLQIITDLMWCFFAAMAIRVLEVAGVKWIANSFHRAAYFDRIQDALFHEYVLETLSGPSREPPGEDEYWDEDVPFFPPSMKMEPSDGRQRGDPHTGLPMGVLNDHEDGNLPQGPRPPTGLPGSFPNPYEAEKQIAKDNLGFIHNAWGLENDGGSLEGQAAQNRGEPRGEDEREEGAQVQKHGGGSRLASVEEDWVPVSNLPRQGLQVDLESGLGKENMSASRGSGVGEPGSRPTSEPEGDVRPEFKGRPLSGPGPGPGVGFGLGAGMDIGGVEIGDWEPEEPIRRQNVVPKGPSRLARVPTGLEASMLYGSGRAGGTSGSESDEKIGASASMRKSTMLRGQPGAVPASGPIKPHNWPSRQDRLQNLTSDTVSAWTMRRLIKRVRKNKIATYAGMFDEEIQGSAEIDSELQARFAAKHIFDNLARPGQKHLTLEDFERFLVEEHAAKAFVLFDGADSGRISRRSLVNWVVSVYKERKALALTLSDSKTVVSKLQNVLDVVMLLVLFVVSLLILGVDSSRMLVLFSSIIIPLVFVFGNQAKLTFESLVFLFIMHPFDVGDRITVEGTSYVVEEINVLYTVLLNGISEKVYWPNDVLKQKPISNVYRSPHQWDSYEFEIPIVTPMDKVNKLKDRIQKYVDSQPQTFYPFFRLVCKEALTSLKMGVWFQHRMNWQEIGERNQRRSNLILHLRSYLIELGIADPPPPPQQILAQLVDALPQAPPPK